MMAPRSLRVLMIRMAGKELTAARSEKRRELTMFVFLALVMAPIIAVIVVAGFGFAVWMYQLIAGPPGPPL
jgi:nitrate reductase NapE